MFTRHEGRVKPLNVAERFAAREAERKNLPRDAYLNDYWSVFAVSISLLIMCYSYLFKTVPILIFLGLWLPLLLKNLRLLKLNSAILLNFSIPLLCIASTLWSDYPSKTLYFGTAFLVSIICITIIARNVRFDALLKGILLGTSLIVLSTLLNGCYAVDYMSGTYALVGIFPSKNIVGFIAEIGTLTAMIVVYIQPGWLKKLFYGAIPLVICLTCLFLSRSGTAILSLIFALSALGVAITLKMTPATIRYLLLGISPVLIAALLIFVTQVDWQSWALKNLGKDTTLTGRTYLWQEGTKIAKTRPLLGHGYNAFWIQGQPQAERYWQEFQITARMGFHFHSTFVQSAVDIGFLGAGLVTLLILANCILSIRAVICHGTKSEPLFLLGFSFMFLLRAFVEVDFFTGPFGPGVFMFYLILPRLAQLKPHNPSAIAPVSPAFVPKRDRGPHPNSSSRALAPIAASDAPPNQ